jgi:hypothetical protein
MESDPISFEPDGGIVVVFDDKPLRLRPPKVGEFKKLRNAAIANIRGWANLLDDLQDATARDTTDDQDAERDRLEVEQLDVLSAVFATLGDHDGWPRDPEEWPSWTIKPGLLSRFVNHWREVPLARGPVALAVAPPPVTTGTLPPQQ